MVTGGTRGEGARNTRDIQPIVILSRKPHGDARSPSGMVQNDMRAKVLPIRDAREGKGLQQTGNEIKAPSVDK